MSVTSLGHLMAGSVTEATVDQMTTPLLRDRTSSATLRAATAAPEPAVVRVREGDHRVTGTLEVLHRADLGSRFSSPADLHRWLNHPGRGAWVIEIGDAVVSAGLAHHVDGPEAELLNTRWSDVVAEPVAAAGDGYVSAVATDAAVRGRGHMGLVLASELAWFGRSGTSTVVTLSWRRLTQSSFGGLKAAGFAHVADIERYWAGYPETASLMRCSLIDAASHGELPPRRVRAARPRRA